MSAPANCRLIGRWRIVEADIWDRAHLNLCGPATLTITEQGGQTEDSAVRQTSELWLVLFEVTLQGGCKDLRGKKG
jgi:hypothetical protein